MLTGWFHTQRQNLWTSLIAKIFFVKGNGLLRGTKMQRMGSPLARSLYNRQLTFKLANPFIGSFQSVLFMLKTIIGESPFQKTYQAG